MVLPTVTVDIGTTSVKLALFDARAELAALSRHPTPTTKDGSGEVYDLPALTEMIDGFVRGLTDDERGSVRRVAITGVGESGGLVRPDLSLASPMIVWHDQRGAAYLSRLSGQERQFIYQTTGLPPSPNYGVSKAAWAASRAEGRGAVWLNIAEYVAALMTGERWSEPSLASRTMALDLTAGTWSADVCGLFGLHPSTFPHLRRAANGVPITAAYAAGLGIDPAVQIHVAGHDHMVGAVGAGLQPGELLNSTGTTEGLLVLGDAPRLDEDAEQYKLANGLAVAGNGYTLFASIPTGGSAFATLQQLVGLDADGLSAILTSLHARYVGQKIDLDAVPLVLPRFRGAPPPTKDHAARGIIAGLRTDTSREDIVFGCFLGMVLEFADVLDLFDVSPRRIKVIGPASTNPLWLQLKADLLGARLSVSQIPEVVSRGAQALTSGEDVAWEGVGPREVVPSPSRHAELKTWRSDVREQWTYLQGYC